MENKRNTAYIFIPAFMGDSGALELLKELDKSLIRA